MKFIGLFASALIASVLANPVLEHGSTETTKAPKAQKTHSSGHHEHKGKHEGKGFPPCKACTTVCEKNPEHETHGTKHDMKLYNHSPMGIPKLAKECALSCDCSHDYTDL